MKTAWGVHVADIVATRLIRIGGIGTIVAVSLVFFFLLAVVLPLFVPARIDATATINAPSNEPIVYQGSDESRTLAWVIGESGVLRVFRLDNGEVIRQQPLVTEAKVTSACASSGDHVALGLENGSIVVGRVRVTTRFLDEDQAEQMSPGLKAGEIDVADGRVTQRMTQGMTQGQIRETEITADMQPPVAVLANPVVALDYLPAPEGGAMSQRVHRIAAADKQNLSKLCLIREKQNPLTRKTKLDLSIQDLPPWEHDAPLSYLLISSRGDYLLRIGRDGFLQRLQLGDAVQVAEQTRLTPDGVSLSVCGWILGRETILCGDDRGGLHGWFRAPADDAATSDGHRMVPAHRLKGSTAVPTSFGASQRSRLVAVGFGDGSLRVYHMTSEKRVLEQMVAPASAIRHVMLSPRDDGLLALAESSMWRAELHPRHPEVTAATLFLPVWYEGYDRPMHTWQSSSATSAPEMKLGLFALVFGTLKATLYTMVFSAPVALLAAIYTSEFLAPKVRARLKPCIEMMASLPSVVLGFLAAVVFAPYAESAIVTILLSLFVIPFTLVLSGYLWQLLPRETTLRLASYRLWALAAVLPVGVFMSFVLSWPAERWLYAGDVVRWLDGQVGSGVGAGTVLLLPWSIIVVAVFAVTTMNPWLRSRAQAWSRLFFASVDLCKFILLVLGAWGMALGGAWLLHELGWDPRSGMLAPFGTYQQRNSLIVAFVMGFAVIPIIYTIADDAFHAVPNHLRSASLGAGATKWQTALRIVLPTAMSGLFSALMVGLGRAVGETMIVLMAGGNTPLLDLNMFNGFRTMSANVATELPEAVRDSTHYRTLFLSALTLFALTFAVNTVAEIVRLRFRRRAVQL